VVTFSPKTRELYGSSERLAQLLEMRLVVKGEWKP